MRMSQTFRGQILFPPVWAPKGMTAQWQPCTATGMALCTSHQPVLACIFQTWKYTGEKALEHLCVAAVKHALLISTGLGVHNGEYIDCVLGTSQSWHVAVSID